MTGRAPSCHETDERSPSSKRSSTPEDIRQPGGTEKPLGCQVLKGVLSIQKCAEQSAEDRFARGYRGTIREDRGSSKVGKKSMCKKGAKSPAKRRVDHTPERPIETSWSSTVHERHPLALRNDASSRNRNRWERSRNGWASHFYRRSHQKR